MRTAYIALGANLEEPARQIEAAIERLKAEADVRLIARSRLYRSAPVGPAGQGDYCNAVCSIETALTPLQLLHRLQVIENDAGRRRDGPRWGPRVLDLDLLHVPGVRSDTPELILPHPHLHERNFVLVPLAEIAPDLMIDERGAISDLAQRSDRRGLTPWR